MDRTVPEFHMLGDSAMMISWENIIDRNINALVHSLAAQISRHPFEGLVDIVPAYCSVTVLYDPVIIAATIQKEQAIHSFVSGYITDQLDKVDDSKSLTPTIKEVPVCFDKDLGNDMDIISNYAGISKRAVIDLYLDQTYYVYMAGFLPGFVYMGDVAEQITIPRKQKPVKVKAGAVAIAGKQTGIYPVASPGGWHIAGYTPFSMFNPDVAMPAFLSPGDAVRFVEIDASKFHELKSYHTA